MSIPTDAMPNDPTPTSSTNSSPQPSTAAEQLCPICGVTIQSAVGGDRVLFSSGPVGTRAKLWARVCQFVNKPECINRDKATIGQVSDADYFRPDPGKST